MKHEIVVFGSDTVEVISRLLVALASEEIGAVVVLVKAGEQLCLANVPNGVAVDMLRHEVSYQATRTHDERVTLMTIESDPESN
jgi:hypothetical protein